MSQPSDHNTMAIAVEKAAAMLAAFEGSDAFSPYLPDTPDRMPIRQAYRQRAEALLQDADAFKVCQAIAELVTAAEPGSRAEQVARTAYAAAIAAAGVRP